MYDIDTTSQTAKLTATLAPASGSTQFGAFPSFSFLSLAWTDSLCAGYDVAVIGNAILVGEPYYYTGWNYYHGRAQFFTKSGTTWTYALLLATVCRRRLMCLLDAGAIFSRTHSAMATVGGL